MLRKLLISGASVLGVLILIGAVFVAARQNLRFDDTPYPDVAASTDPAVVERGRYIVRVVAPCAGCHGDPSQRVANASGADVPLVGGVVFDIPLKHITDATIRSHHQSIEVRINDAPHADEIVIALAAAAQGRPQQRLAAFSTEAN